MWHLHLDEIWYPRVSEVSLLWMCKVLNRQLQTQDHWCLWEKENYCQTQDFAISCIVYILIAALRHKHSQSNEVRIGKCVTTKFVMSSRPGLDSQVRGHTPRPFHVSGKGMQLVPSFVSCFSVGKRSVEHILAAFVPFLIKGDVEFRTYTESIESLSGMLYIQILI